MYVVDGDLLKDNFSFDEDQESIPLKFLKITSFNRKMVDQDSDGYLGLGDYPANINEKGFLD